MSVTTLRIVQRKREKVVIAATHGPIIMISKNKRPPRQRRPEPEHAQAKAARTRTRSATSISLRTSIGFSDMRLFMSYPKSALFRSEVRIRCARERFNSTSRDRAPLVWFLDLPINRHLVAWPACDLHMRGREESTIRLLMHIPCA